MRVVEVQQNVLTLALGIADGRFEILNPLDFHDRPLFRETVRCPSSEPIEDYLPAAASYRFEYRVTLWLVSLVLSMIPKAFLDRKPQIFSLLGLSGNATFHP